MHSDFFPTSFLEIVATDKFTVKPHKTQNGVWWFSDFICCASLFNLGSSQMELSAVSFAIGCCDFIFGQLSCACSMLVQRAASNPLSSCRSSCSRSFYLFFGQQNLNYKPDERNSYCVATTRPHNFSSLSQLSYPRIPFSSLLPLVLPLPLLPTSVPAEILDTSKSSSPQKSQLAGNIVLILQWIRELVTFPWSCLLSNHVTPLHQTLLCFPILLWIKPRLHTWAHKALHLPLKDPMIPLSLGPVLPSINNWSGSLIYPFTLVLRVWFINPPGWFSQSY